jgi:hypothetical protein
VLLEHINIVNLSTENVPFTYYHLKLDKTQNKTGCVIILIDSGGIVGTVMFSVIAE